MSCRYPCECWLACLATPIICSRTLTTRPAWREIISTSIERASRLEVIDHVQRSKRSARGQGIAHEIQRPGLVSLFRYCEVFGQCEQASAFSVFVSDAKPSLDTLCGCACGSNRVPGFSDSLSSCHNPNEAAMRAQTPAAPVPEVDLKLFLPGSDRHNDFNLDRATRLSLTQSKLGDPIWR